MEKIDFYSKFHLEGLSPGPRPPVACEYWQATCANGECIDKTAICDGDVDCQDGSDESSCSEFCMILYFILYCAMITGENSLCEPNEYQCDNKKCVLKTW